MIVEPDIFSVAFEGDHVLDLPTFSCFIPRAQNTSQMSLKGLVFLHMVNFFASSIIKEIVMSHRAMTIGRLAPLTHFWPVSLLLFSPGWRPHAVLAN